MGRGTVGVIELIYSQGNKKGNNEIKIVLKEDFVVQHGDDHTVIRAGPLTIIIDSAQAKRLKKAL